MRYKLWLYRVEGFNRLAVQISDRHTTSFMMRDVSNYPEDGGRFVWKNATFPLSVHFAIKDDGICIAEAMHLSALDANMNYRVLDNLWKNYKC